MGFLNVPNAIQDMWIVYFVRMELPIAFIVIQVTRIVFIVRMEKMSAICV